MYCINAAIAFLRVRRINIEIKKIFQSKLGCCLTVVLGTALSMFPCESRGEMNEVGRNCNVTRSLVTAASRRLHLTHHFSPKSVENDVIIALMLILS